MDGMVKEENVRMLGNGLSSVYANDRVEDNRLWMDSVKSDE